MTATERPKTIPIVPVAHDEAGDCAGAEPFVLMVLGDSMAPEFAEAAGSCARSMPRAPRSRFPTWRPCAAS